MTSRTNQDLGPSRLTVVAHIHAVPGQVEFLKAALEGLLAPTRAEAGCLQYDLHQDEEDPAHFLFYENWESPEHWQAHGRSAHIAAYREAAKAAIAEIRVHRMQHLA